MIISNHLFNVLGLRRYFSVIVWDCVLNSVFFLKECAKRIAKVSAEAKLEIDEENYLNSFRPNLMDVVYTWANGATFAHICKMTDVFEGVYYCVAF